MKVILIKDCKDGKANNIIDVKDGYGKNFLIKNGLAIPHNESNLKLLNKKLENIKKDFDLHQEEAIVLKNKIEKLELEFSLKVTNDVIHGSITTKKVNQALIDNGIKFKKHILQDIHISSIGKTEVKINLFEGVIATLKVKVLKKD